MEPPGFRTVGASNARTPGNAKRPKRRSPGPFRRDFGGRTRTRTWGPLIKRRSTIASTFLAMRHILVQDSIPFAADQALETVLAGLLRASIPIRRLLKKLATAK